MCLKAGLFNLNFSFSGVDSSTQVAVVEKRVTKPGFLPVPKLRRRPTCTVLRPPESPNR